MTVVAEPVAYGAAVPAPDPIVLTVVGVPYPQGDKSAIIRGGKPRTIDGKSNQARASLAAWRGAVADACRRHLETSPMPPIAEPVKVTIVFRFAPVASDQYRTLHTTRPDLDKILRSTFDALTFGGLLADDSLVWKLEAEKRYCAPGEAAGCTVTVERFGWYEAEQRAALKAAAAEARKRKP